MGLYTKNLFRAIRKNLMPYIGSVLIIGIASTLFIGVTDLVSSTNRAVSQYAENTNFADVFVEIESMQEDQVEAFAEIEGVDMAFGRLEETVRLIDANSERIVTLRLLAYEPEDTCNILKINKDTGVFEDNMILIGSKMQAVYHFSENQSLDLLFGNKKHSLNYGGTMQAIEYLYSVPAEGLDAPNYAIFDVAAVHKSKLEELSGKKNVVNKLFITLKPGYSYWDVKYQVEQLAQPYGIASIYERKDQMSYTAITDEMEQTRQIGLALPTIFLLASVFMLYIILKKIIENDRTLIGTMKAFGTSNRALLFNYMQIALIIGFLGFLIGVLLGPQLGLYVYKEQITFYNLPTADYHTRFSTLAVSFFIAVGTSVLATYIGVSDVLKITPAESMRVAEPTVRGKVKLPPKLDAILNSRQKMGLRSIFRNVTRSFIIAFAIGIPFGMMVNFSSFDQINAAMYFNKFEKSETYDMKVVFDTYDDAIAVLSAVQSIPYVNDVETIATYPVTMRNGNLYRYNTLTVLNRDSDLYKIVDIDGRHYQPPDDGIIIGEILARKLDLAVGDFVEIENPYISSFAVRVPVVEIARESVGTGCYISPAGMQHFFNQPQLATMILLEVADGKTSEVEKAFLDTKCVVYVINSAEILQSYKDMTKALMTVFDILNIFAIVMASVLIYNMTNIGISERKNEFGTLMILGTPQRHISEIIAFEQGINFIFGILIGLASSFGIKTLLEKIMSSTNYIIEMDIPLHTYLTVGLICLVIMVFSILFISRNLQKIQLVDILKERT